MGLFDRFFGEDAKLQRQVRRLTNRDSQPDDRESSARWLAEKGTPAAIAGLLARFDLNLDHQMKDSGEKENVYALVVGLGDRAIEPTRAWLRACKQIAMPLRVLAELQGHEAAVLMAFELLDLEFKKDNFKPEKKKALLVWLAEVRHPGAVAAATPFLKDFDEGVRYSAAEVIISQGGDDGVPALVAALVNPREESNRIRVRIAEAFSQRGWRLPGDDVHLPDGYALREGRVAHV